MDQVEQQEFRKIVRALHAGIRAGPYHDVAADAILNLHPTILQFWNHRFSVHCQSLNEMKSSYTEFLDKNFTASRQDKDKFRKNQISRIAAINRECEAAERMSRIIDDTLGIRAELFKHRGFALTFRVGHDDESPEPDTPGLRKGIQAHMAHWESWWMALENHLRYIHERLDLETGFLQTLCDPCNTVLNRSGIKVIGVLEKRLKRLSKEQAKGLEALKEVYRLTDALVTRIQNLIPIRNNVLQELVGLLYSFQETLQTEDPPDRMLRKRKRSV